MSTDKTAPKSLDQLICFSLYTATNAMNRIYNPQLKKFNLTYPQYLVMLALWQKDCQTVGSLCQQLYLESSTVTPLLKRLEKTGYITRNRSKKDERQVIIKLTAKGSELADISCQITACIEDAAHLEKSEAEKLLREISSLRDSLAQFTSQQKAK
ncbi:MAG: MarR family transcriptional regulator [Hyphomicrobiales bacterium]